jgi:hypothetical protein
VQAKEGCATTVRADAKTIAGKTLKPIFII